jgi:hypothetical protein
LAAYVVWQLEYNCSYPQLIPKWSTQRFSQQDAIAVANVSQICVLQICISINPASICVFTFLTETSVYRAGTDESLEHCLGHQR